MSSSGYTEVIIAIITTWASHSRRPTLTYEPEDVSTAISAELRGGLDTLRRLYSGCTDLSIRRHYPMLAIFHSILVGQADRTFDRGDWLVEEGRVWTEFTDPDQISAKVSYQEGELRGRIIPSTPTGSRPRWQADFYTYDDAEAGQVCIQAPGKLPGEAQTNLAQAEQVWGEQADMYHIGATLRDSHGVIHYVKPRFIR